MNGEISHFGDSDPVRWTDAVRRRHPGLTPSGGAELAEQMDRFTKRSYADGYDIVAIRVGRDGSLEFKSPILREIAEGEE